MNPYRLEKANVAILVINQALFIVAAVTVMTLSGVVGKGLSPDPALATLPIATMMFGTVLTTLPASLFMKRVGRRRGFITGAGFGGVGGGLLSFVAIGVESFWLFCLGSLLLGLYQSFAMYYRFAAADVASPAFRSRAISLVLAGGIAAAFLGPWNASATEWIASVPLGGPYLMIALLAVLAIGLLAQLKVPASGEPMPGEPSRPMTAIAAQPRFQVALVAAAIGYAVMMLLMAATPLAMRDKGFGVEQVTFIMQWHVLAMFVPSFFSGSLIARAGIGAILFVGCLLLVATVIAATHGSTLTHFWLALVLLGVSWNFLFIGGSILLSTIHTEAERGKVQGINDLIIFSLVALGTLLSGSLLYYLGWEMLNLTMLAPIAVLGFAILWLWLSANFRSARVDNP